MNSKQSADGARAARVAGSPMATQLQAPPPPAAWRQIGLMMTWQAGRAAETIPLVVLVQVLLSIATVAGYGFLVGDVKGTPALYLATGAPTAVLIMIGLVMTPQMVSQARTEGSLDWQRTLPVPRLVFLVADLAYWTLLALPGMVLGLIAGAWRFDVPIRPAWWIVLLVPAVSATAAAIGYGFAVLLKPALAQLMSQFLVFLVLLFSPVSYPASRLPEALARAHQYLPVEPLAALMRAALVPASFQVEPRAVIVAILWLAASLAGASWAITRRR